jgi:hypothetical protein
MDDLEIDAGDLSVAVAVTIKTSKAISSRCGMYPLPFWRIA